MNITDFLRYRETNLDTIVATLQSHVGIAPDDVVLAVGSLIEGLGNRKSDIDLLLITERDRDDLPEQEEFALVVGRCVVDLHVLLMGDIARLLERFRAWARLPWDVAHAVTFSQAERTLLHRFLNGRQLVNAPPDRIAALTPDRQDLCRLKLQVARQMARTIQVDLVGYRDCGDYRTCALAAQDLLGQAVDALTAGHELTNPVAKWRHRLLDRLPENWADALALPTAPMDASAFIWSLHRVPEKPSPEACAAYTARIIGFARAAFAWSEERLVNTSFPWQSLSRVEASHTGRILAGLDYDVDFSLGESKALLAKLNEFETPVHMSPAELMAALLFDGTTTAEQVATLMNGHPRTEQISEVIALHDRLSAAGLILC